jgi:hypothetical protein
MASVNHAARLAAERQGLPVDVRVVQLRNREHARQAAGRTVDWRHRWVVSLHKVRQWYPSEQRHKIILRGPYVKGPADKPLLDRDVVRALTR